MALNINNTVIIELGAKYDFALDYIIKNNLYHFIMAYPGHRMYLAIKIGEELRGEESLNVDAYEDILIRASVNIFDGIHPEGEKMISYITKTGNFEKLLSLCPDFENKLYPKKDQKREQLVFHMQVIFMIEFYKKRQLGKLETFITEIEAFVFGEETTNKIQNQSEKTSENEIQKTNKPDVKSQNNLIKSKQKRTLSGRKLLFTGLPILLLLFVAIATNPRTGESKRAVRNYLSENLIQLNSANPSENYSLSELRKQVYEYLVDPKVYSDNYVFFSITYFAGNDIGIGAFGKVFIYGEINESEVFVSSYSSEKPDMQNDEGFNLVMSGEEGGDYVEEWNQLIDDVNYHTNEGEHQITIKHDDGSAMVTIRYEIDSAGKPVKGSAKLAPASEKNTFVFVDGTVIHYPFN